MKVVIIEDEKPTAQRLRDMLLSVESSVEEVHLVHSIEEGIPFFESHTDMDLILLDIELGDGTGFELLDTVQTKQRVVFTTAYNEHAIRAFNYNTIDYLLKPITSSALSKAIAKSKERAKQDIPELLEQLKEFRSQSFKKRFLVKLGHKVILVDVNDIAYFFSEDGYTFIQTSDAKHLIDFSLDALEEILDPALFFRVNRKFIMHINALETIATYFNSRLCVTLKPDAKETIVISRNRVKEFKTWVEGL